MNRSEFDDHMNMYGGDLSKWPANLQKQAYFYLQNNPQDFEELEFFKDIERELSSRENTRASRSLVDDVMADLSDDEAVEEVVIQPSGFMKKAGKMLSSLSKGNAPAFALAGSLACGIIIGVWSGMNDNASVGDLALLDDTVYTVFYLF